MNLQRLFAALFLVSLLATSSSAQFPYDEIVIQEEEYEPKFLSEDELHTARSVPVADLEPPKIHLTSEIVRNCVADQDNAAVVLAFLDQLKNSDLTKCSDNSYFTNHQIILLLRGFGTDASPNNAAACLEYDKSLVKLFKSNEEHAARHGVCYLERPLPICEVSNTGNANLRFRNFPHIDNIPDTKGVLSTRLDVLKPGSLVVMGSAYKGWAWVSAAGVEGSGERSTGWVSREYLTCR